MNSTEQLATGTWQLDPSATTVTVSATKLGFYDVPATFDVTSGVVEIDDNHQVTKVEVVVDAASYTSKTGMRNKHIVSKDFLDAERHRSISFQSNRVTPASDGYTAEGTLTVKGESSPMTVTVTDLDVQGESVVFSCRATVDREEIGVGAMPMFYIGRKLRLAVSASISKAT